MDHHDKKIVSLLQKDAKLTIKEIAAKVKLSTTPVHERIKKLESSGVIKAYKARVDRKKIGLPLMVFCNVNLNQHQSSYIKQFEKDILQFNEVLECYHVAGIYDYLMKIAVSNMEHYQQFVADKLASLDNIAKVQSSFVMTTVIESEVYPLD